MKKGLLLAGLSLAFTVQTSAQNPESIPRCGFELIEKHYQQLDPSYKIRRDATFQASKNKAAAGDTVYRIPVVFHVVYNKPEQNLHDSVILNQLAVLNGAYRKSHADTSNLRDIFKPLAADAKIEFYLAGIDPDGNPSTGITRTATSTATFGDIAALFGGDFTTMEKCKSTLDGGIDPWPAGRYLNIWIVNMEFPLLGPALLGYATPPTNPLPPNWGEDGSGFEMLKDGVVIQYQAVGSNNPTLGAMAGQMGTAGRTAVHEVGHYLGLRHIWGDAAGSANACATSGDDGIDDTPPQADKSPGGANCPLATQNTCGTGTPGDMPDLWENYMDYSRDNCQNMLTHGQVNHMRSILSNQRDTLVSGVVPETGLSMAQTVAPNIHSLIVYPQPAGDKLSIAFEGNIDELHLSNAMGQTVVSFHKMRERQMDISQLPGGVYFLKLRDGRQVYSRTVLIQR